MELHQLMEAGEVVTTTFGPLERYVPANDNFKGAKDLGSGGGVVCEPLTYEQFEREATHLGHHVVPPRPAFSDRRGDYMQTYSGRKFWPLDPRADEVDILDIAHSLSRQCRFAGHCISFYSVAEHSVILARWLLREDGLIAARWGLLHDATEAYLVDVPRPVKPFLVNYKEAEAKLQEVIADRFALPPQIPDIVHEADRRIIGDEVVNLLPMEWHKKHEDEKLGVRMRYWSPDRAKEEFLATYDALMSRRAVVGWE